MELLFQPYIQVRANMALVYTRYIGPRRKSYFDRQKELQKHSAHNFQTSKTYTGSLTAGAIKRLRKSIELLVECSQNRTVYSKVVGKNIQHKLSFITLTIPTAEKIELKEATKLLLEPMLRHLRQVHGMKNYVWKVELQERGQLHWHITSDVYVPHSELRNKWNQLLLRNNYMSEYLQKKGHSNANSTDIHSVRKVRDLSAYLVKYFTKKSQNPEQLQGKIWDCSKNLKSAKYFETELTADCEFDIYQHEGKGNIKLIRKDKFTLIRFNKMRPIAILPIECRKAYHQNLVDIREGVVRSKVCTKNNTTVLNLVHQKQDSSKITFKGQQLTLRL